MTSVLIVRSRRNHQFRLARPHRRHVARIVIRRRRGERLAAADQEIDDVVAQRVVIGMAVQIDAAAILRQRIFHDLGQHRAGTVGHQKNPVGEIDRLIDVMGDHERGLSGLQANPADLVLQRAARQRIQRRERLVHQHDLWRDRERPRDADALLHAAGQFRGTLVLGAGQADQIDEGLRMRLHLGAVPVAPFRGDGIGDVAEHRAPRQQRMALEDHGAVEAGALDRLPVDDNSAFARLHRGRPEYSAPWSCRSRNGRSRSRTRRAPSRARDSRTPRLRRRLRPDSACRSLRWK